MVSYFFFFNDTATTEIYTLSLHDALPILCVSTSVASLRTHLCLTVCPKRTRATIHCLRRNPEAFAEDRKSTRLNSSHANISYAVFCLKKKKRIVPIPLLNNCSRESLTPPG